MQTTLPSYVMLEETKLQSQEDAVVLKVEISSLCLIGIRIAGKIDYMTKFISVLTVLMGDPRCVSGSLLGCSLAWHAWGPGFHSQHGKEKKDLLWVSK